MCDLTIESLLDEILLINLETDESGNFRSDRSEEEHYVLYHTACDRRNRTVVTRGAPAARLLNARRCRVASSATLTR